MSPVRTCLGCRGRDEQLALVRLVRVVDDVVDATAPRLPGRGGYLHRDPRCWEMAVRRRAIQRFFGPGARMTASLPADWDQSAPTR